MERRPELSNSTQDQEDRDHQVGNSTVQRSAHCPRQLDCAPGATDKMSEKSMIAGSEGLDRGQVCAGRSFTRSCSGGWGAVWLFWELNRIDGLLVVRRKLELSRCVCARNVTLHQPRFPAPLTTHLYASRQNIFHSKRRNIMCYAWRCYLDDEYTADALIIIARMDCYITASPFAAETRSPTSRPPANSQTMSDTRTRHGHSCVRLRLSVHQAR